MSGYQNNSICNEFFVDIKSPTPFFYYTCLSLLIFAYIFIPSSIAYFAYYRNTFERLRKRNFFLVATLAIGVLVFISYACLRYILGATDFPCHVLIPVGAFANILILRSGVLRLFGLFWRIRFNKSLIDATFQAVASGTKVIMPGSPDVFTTGEEEKELRNTPNNVALNALATNKTTLKRTLLISRRIMKHKIAGENAIFLAPCLYKLFCWESTSDLPPNLHFQQFLASKRNVNLLYIYFAILEFSLILLYHFSVIPFDIYCVGCDGKSAVLVIYFFLFSSAFFGVLDVCLLRKDSDSLGIINEMYVLVGVYLIVVLIRFPFYATDFEINGQYSSDINDSLAMLCFVFYTLPYQVIKAKRLDKLKRNTDHDTLQKILNDNEAIKAFALYLASHLSIENLLFYRVVENWVEKFSNRDEEIALAQAKIIFNNFIDKDAPYMINISYRLRDQLTQDINTNTLDRHYFDKAKVAVFISMDNEIAQFHKSPYYKAYAKQLTTIYDDIG